MTTEVNLMAMLRDVKHTQGEDAKRKQQTATFKEEQNEKAKRYTKEPPKLIAAFVKRGV